MRFLFTLQSQPEFVNNAHVSKDRSFTEQKVLGRGKVVNIKKWGKPSVKINNHNYPAGCTCCADIDLFHTVADRSNSFSLILVLNGLNASPFFTSVFKHTFYVGVCPIIQYTFRLLFAPCRATTHFHPTVWQCADSLGVTANQTIIPLMRAAERVPVKKKEGYYF